MADSRTSKVYSVANGGHQDYAGNEVDVLDLERELPEWSQILAPTPGAQLTNCQSYYADGRPVSRHSYYGVTLDEFDDRIMLLGGANWCSNGGFHSAISSYNIGTNSYNGAGMHPNLPYPFDVLSSYALDPATGNVYVNANGQIGRWNRSSNTFTANLNSAGSGASANDTMAAFDTSRGRILFLGGPNADHHLYTPSGNAWSTIALTGANAADVTGLRKGAMVYAPALDLYLVRNDLAGGTIFQINPSTFAVTTFATTGGASIPSTQNGPYNKFLYVPRLGGAVYVPSYSGNAWFLKTNATNSQPPAPTVTLSASPTSIASGASATLTWSSTNSTACTASNGWSGAKATSGTQGVTPAANTTYTLACTGTGGTAMQSTTVSVSVQNTALPLGTLNHDGPATPEQISLLLPVTGALPQTATATVRYKPTNSPTWITGHPLYRIRPDLALPADVGSVPDAFAWPIIDLTPGTTYDVEVTVLNAGTTDLRTASFTTRTLPAAAGAPNKTITAGASAATIQAELDGLHPGDVLQFQNGTYDLSTNLQLKRSGAVNSPIYIRGASRAGVVLSNPGLIFQILNSSHVVIENLTLQGSGVDSGVNASSKGISFWDGAPNQTRITVRNITMTGVDTGITADAEISEFLAYDNTLLGNNTWTAALIDTNATWNDDSMRIPGFGNCAFNNTLKGFGDSFSFAQHFRQVIGVHFYRNDVLMGGDDGVEVDEGMRNLTFYDNRLRNTMTFVSLDPLFGGPLVVARNIAINIGRTPFKWNSQNAGQFVYNNTIVRTTGKDWVASPGSAAEAGWYQPNNGDQSSYGFQNNILVYRGAGGQTIRLDNSGHNPVDFTNNSWFPNLVFQWPEGRYANLAAAQSGLANTTPVFSGSTRRMQNDNVTGSNPWTTTITLGPDYHTEVTTAYTPALAAGSTPKNSGAIIPNITDGFTGGAPDRGAIIEGRPIPQYGDRNGTTDSIPDAFSFASQTGVAPLAETSSNTITVAGINIATPVSIVGGSYSINGGDFTTSAGTVNNGDRVTLHLRASASYGVTATATLTIGQVNGTFSVTTMIPIVVEYVNTTEFPNSPGGHFFYSSDPAEQAAVDAGAAGNFARTGRQFPTGGTLPVCRFYGSVAPGPNSHFFTVDVSECSTLKTAQVTPIPTTVPQWNYEGLDYFTTPPSVTTNGVRTCPATTQPVYRAYNNAFSLSGQKNSWDSNHRFTPRLADIADMVTNGWRDEGIVFCTAQ